MTRPIAVLRPEPGNAALAERIEAAGLPAVRVPLFAIRPIAWTAPDPAAFDALILTSANAVRHGGAGLATLRGLPVHAVGSATAHAAAAAGFDVAMTGAHGAAALIAACRDAGVRRALRLAGREHVAVADPIIADTRIVYASEPVEPGPAGRAVLAGSVALVQSPRAAARLATLAAALRPTIAVVAISAAAARAAGPGWQTVRIAPSPDTDTLIALARTLAD